MPRMNHARIQHRGRLAEPARDYHRKVNPKYIKPAEAANDGRVLSAKERAEIAAQYGYPVS